MSIRKWYGAAPVRVKLLGAFLLVLIPTSLLSGFLSTSMVRRSIEAGMEQQLSNATHAITSMVKTAATVSIKNYLRAVAEKNLEIATELYARHQRGEISRREFIDRLREVLLSQRIGKTGYIYCIDSRGVATVHPRKGVEGKQWLDHAFIHEQIRKKTGYLEYDWKNPEDEDYRPKALYMAYFEPLDWIISVSTYRKSFRSSSGWRISGRASARCASGRPVTPSWSARTGSP